MTVSARCQDLLRTISVEILDAQRPLRVLRALTWDASIERRFFAGGGQEQPQPTYQIPIADVSRSLERFRDLKTLVPGDNGIERFLRDTCDSFATAARMLLAVGTKDFYFHSAELYGRPESLSADRRTTNLDLARHFARVVDGLAGNARVQSPVDEEVLSAEEVVPELQSRFAASFPDRVIRVEIVDDIAAKASARIDLVQVKRDARFSRRDLLQLEHHEGHVHLATALNGRAQPVVPFVGYPSPRATGTQEGLAVLTEFLTQSAGVERLRRLADRTIAIKMAEDGAGFIDLYRFLRAGGYDEGSAFDAARRVCRGGVLSGGAPFTKDVCYLDGLLRVTNFLRVALVKGHVDYVCLFFAGKIDSSDVPLFGRLRREGLVIDPRYVPAWARDLSYLTAFMSYVAFLGEIDLSEDRRRYEDLIAHAEGDLI
ncbi:MAG: flavohemoglobin expression-modulating QEGLA motif protein [Pseudomonadota bacterium]